MFQHVRTGYDTINVTLKRIHYVKGNASDITTGSGNITKIVEVYDEERVVRSLNYGDGINVLGQVKKYFSYFSTKTYLVCTQKNRLIETVLFSIQNIC